jgi:hypothetical protein
MGAPKEGKIHNEEIITTLTQPATLPRLARRRYRGELQALRLEMKAEYDLRSEKASEMQERKFQNAKLKSQQLEAAQYQARQEVIRELEAVRRRELNNRRELDIRKHALELDEQRLNNAKQSMEGKQAEVRIE